MVACHYLNKLFNIDKLPARSGRLKITRQCCPESRRRQLPTRPNKENLAPITSEQQLEIARETPRSCQEAVNQNQNQKLQARMIETVTLKRRRRGRMALGHLQPQTNNKQKLTNSNEGQFKCAELLQASSMILLVALLLAGCHLAAAATAAAATAVSDNLTPRAPSAALRPPGASMGRLPPLNFAPPRMPPTFGAGLDWRHLSSSLINSLERLPFRSNPSEYLTLSEGGSGASGGATRFPSRRISTINRVMNRLRQRIGARNTIRVHNAFRDFAWRVLSGLSMPTPVIYELRRQNFYPAEEDLANDNYHARNTTKTIRSRRHLEATKLSRRASSDDDDDQPETFRERLRTRLEDMLAVSRRSLFGRVVRLPALFPFKRHQEEEADQEGDDRTDGATGKASAKQPSGPTRNNSPATKRPGLMAALTGRRKRRRELDRQIIEINGKQFYVDDDGELKEWKEPAA